MAKNWLITSNSLSQSNLTELEPGEGDVEEVEITALHSHMTDSRTKYNDVTLEPRMIGIDKKDKNLRHKKQESYSLDQDC